MGMDVDKERQTDARLTQRTAASQVKPRGQGGKARATDGCILQPDRAQSCKEADRPWTPRYLGLPDKANLRRA